MGKYIRKNPDDEGIRNMRRIEAAVLQAWKRGSGLRKRSQRLQDCH